MNSFIAIIFDLDGTLLNTLEDLATSMNTVLEFNGFPKYSLEQYRLFVGEGMFNLVIKATKPYTNNQELIHQMYLQMNEEYKQNWHNTTKPYPQIVEVLNLLSNAGFHLNILSNKPDYFTKITVEYFFPKVPFQTIMGASDRIPRKPDPAGVLKIISESGLFLKDFILIGDSGIDIHTAMNACIMPGGALWGYRDQDELIQSGAKFLFTQPEEMYSFLINSNQLGYKLII